MNAWLLSTLLCIHRLQVGQLQGYGSAQRAGGEGWESADHT